MPVQAAEVAGCADAGGLGGLLLPGCQESAPQRGGGRTVPGGDLARVPVASHDAVAVAGPAHGVHVCHPVVRCGEPCPKPPPSNTCRAHARTLTRTQTRTHRCWLTVH